MSIWVPIYFVGILVSLVGLWWSSERTVEYAIKLAEAFSISTFFIGFVLIAISTGLPELAISLASLWNNVPDVAAGAIIGSNLGDVSLVLGIPAILIGTLNVKKEDKLNLMLMLVVTALVMAFVFVVGSIGKLYGAVLIALYVVSIWWLWRSRAVKVVPREDVIEELAGDEKVKRKTFFATRLLLFIKLFASVALVMVTSKLSIDFSIAMLKTLPFSLTALGVTLFALGTSLPELALSMQAVRKREYSLAFGNAFGSVLEQATLILGFLAIGAQKPLQIASLRPIAPLMFLAYAIVAHSLLKKTKVGRQEGLGRVEGIALVTLFIVHVGYFLLKS